MLELVSSMRAPLHLHQRRQGAKLPGETPFSEMAFWELEPLMVKQGPRNWGLFQLNLTEIVKKYPRDLRATHT